MKNDNCRNNVTLVDAYYDGQMEPEEARRYEADLSRSSRSLDDYASISRALKELARRERERGEGGSLWPEIRSRLADESPAGGRNLRRPEIWLWSRPAWVGLALSAAAALIIFFSGILRPAPPPPNYCRIEAISAPGHNLMIHRDASDGFTIIWLME